MYDSCWIQDASSSLQGQETLSVEGFDLTAVDPSYDDHYMQESYVDLTIPSPSDSSGSSQFYLDLTRFSSCTTSSAYTQEDHTEISSAVYPPVHTQSCNYAQAYRELELVSPSPPTPIPQFKVFDLTYYIDDHQPESPQESAGRVNWTSPGSVETLLASPQRQHSSHPSYSIEPSNTSPLQRNGIDSVSQEEEIRESVVVLHSHAVHNDVEEHSTIDVTDFSASHSSVPRGYDMFATDCTYENDRCDDSMFDSLCRGMKPADTGTITPSVTKIEREEIRSCGTLPADGGFKQNKVSPRTYSGRPKKSSNRGRTRTIHLDDDSSDGATVFEKEFLSKYEARYGNTNCSQTSVGGGSPADQDTVITVDSTVDTIVDRREWMGNFVRDLFDQDQTKAIFYASSIAEANLTAQEGVEPPKRKNNLACDFQKVKEFCDFVLQNLDLAEVLENIDAGIYDNHLDEFQEDIELCLEEAMNKYETFMEYEKKKWSSKYWNDDCSETTKERHKNLRLLAGEELMKQLDTDFRMQLLDHFCLHISRRQNALKKPKLHKRQQTCRQIRAS